MYDFLKRHSQVLGLSLAFLGVIGTFLGAWLALNNPTKNEASLENDESTAQPSASAAETFDFIRSKYEQLTGFKFTEYVPQNYLENAREWPSLINVYEASRSTFRSVDQLPCSYPDGTTIQEDYEQGVIVIVCDMPAWIMSNYYEAPDWIQSYIWVFIVLEDRDRIIRETIVTQDEVFYAADVIFDYDNRLLDIVIGGRVKEVWTEDTVDNPIILTHGDLTDSSYRVRMSFDANWLTSDFKQIAYP